MSTGLEIGSLDVNRFIRINNLKEVTNPIMLIRNLPTSDGVLSYDIFGVSQEDRKSRMAYIDLKGKYMKPVAAKTLRQFDRRLSDILFATRKYTLTKGGDLVRDDDGRTGPAFLYEIWGKVKTKDKETIITKEVATYFNQPRDELFMDKLPVIPAFYRDLNTQSGGEKLSASEINGPYCSIISYCQNMDQYTDSFTMMKYVTQGRVQTLINELYDQFVIKKVKGNPAKFGMLQRFLLSKSIDYSSRLVISAPILTADTVEDTRVKYGYATIPLAHVCACFFPFITHHLKKFFDAEFIRGGKKPVMDPDTGEIRMVTIFESYDENFITKMITRFINSPSTRFDPVYVPDNDTGKRGKMVLTGRFLKDNTTFTRPATVTDILYIVASQVVEDKHVYVTRYPLEKYTGQFPARIIISSTIKTAPAMIGETSYQFYPVIKGNPANAFVETLQFSNTYLGPAGGDYDGDTVSVKPVFTREGNEDCEKRIQSNGYVLDVAGELMREMTKDFVLTAYCLTQSEFQLQDANKVTPSYKI